MPRQRVDELLSRNGGVNSVAFLRLLGRAARADDQWRVGRRGAWATRETHDAVRDEASAQQIDVCMLSESLDGAIQGCDGSRLTDFEQVQSLVQVQIVTDFVEDFINVRVRCTGHGYVLCVEVFVGEVDVDCFGCSNAAGGVGGRGGWGVCEGARVFAGGFGRKGGAGDGVSKALCAAGHGFCKLLDLWLVLVVGGVFLRRDCGSGFLAVDGRDLVVFGDFARRRFDQGELVPGLVAGAGPHATSIVGGEVLERLVPGQGGELVVDLVVVPHAHDPAVDVALVGGQGRVPLLLLVAMQGIANGLGHGDGFALVVELSQEQLDGLQRLGGEGAVQLQVQGVRLGLAGGVPDGKALQGIRGLGRLGLQGLGQGADGEDEADGARGRQGLEGGLGRVSAALGRLVGEGGQGGHGAQVLGGRRVELVGAGAHERAAVGGAGELGAEGAVGLVALVQGLEAAVVVGVVVAAARGQQLVGAGGLAQVLGAAAVQAGGVELVLGRHVAAGDGVAAGAALDDVDGGERAARQQAVGGPRGRGDDEGGLVGAVGQLVAQGRAAHRRRARAGAQRHLDKLDLVRRAVAGVVVVALVAQVAAVVLVEQLLAPPPPRLERRADRVVAAAARDHAALVVVVAEALGRLERRRPRRLEVVGRDGRGDGRRVRAPRVGGVGRPPGRAEADLVEHAGVDVDQPLADAVLDRREVRRAQLVHHEAAAVSGRGGREGGGGRGAHSSFWRRDMAAAELCGHVVASGRAGEVVRAPSSGQLEGVVDVTLHERRGLSEWLPTLSGVAWTLAAAAAGERALLNIAPVHAHDPSPSPRPAMNLIAYSDSESDAEAPAPKPAPKPFHKVVDRSQPGRIKLTLPAASLPPAEQDDIEAEAPPAKKARIGAGGGFGGFMSSLPAPKKANVKVTAAGAAPGSRGLGKGLGAGVNLRTGAEPAFKREPKLELEQYDESGNVIKQEPMKKEDFRALLNLPAPKSERKSSPKPESPVSAPDTPESAPLPKPAAPRFVPLSVGKGKKKKPVAARPVAASAAASKHAATPVEDAPPPRKPKVSLFGVAQAAEPPAKEVSSGPYQPMMYGFDEDDDDDDAPAPDEAFAPQSALQSTQRAPAPTGATASSGLTNIAQELNLSEAERRQLFGRKGQTAPDFSSARIVEFNTDTEYAHNEQLRQQGEQVQHNPLKSISGTGKNSLRSLVNVATTQKDALEEHFATSQRNKREAGNRYGW